MSLIEAFRDGSVHVGDLLPPEPAPEPTKRDWVKIASLVVLVISGLIAALSGLCLAGMFPTALLGGFEPTLFTLFGSGMTAAASGGLFYYKWQTQDLDVP